MKSPPKRLDLNLLIVFDAIYKARNATKAGEEIGLSQPAMSHALARLRRMFNDPLFIKQPRGFHPTPYAEQISGTLLQSLSAIRGTLEKARFDPAKSSRIFRLAMTDIGEQVLLPALCTRLSALASGIRIETCQPPVRELREAMASGSVDLALGHIPQLIAGFHQRRLYRSEYVCIVRKGHPSINASLSLKQYREALHAVPYSTATAHGETIEKAILSPRVKGKISVRLTHFLALPAIISSSNLIATIPINFAESIRSLVDIWVLPPPIDLPGFDVKLYWHERAHAEPGNQWLRRICAELLVGKSLRKPAG
jgi:DNA-binding transcriptional LysR family regulator